MTTVEFSSLTSKMASVKFYFVITVLRNKEFEGFYALPISAKQPRTIQIFCAPVMLQTKEQMPRTSGFWVVTNRD